MALFREGDTVAVNLSPEGRYDRWGYGTLAQAGYSMDCWVVSFSDELAMCIPSGRIREDERDYSEGYGRQTRSPGHLAGELTLTLDFEYDTSKQEDGREFKYATTVISRLWPDDDVCFSVQEVEQSARSWTVKLHALFIYSLLATKSKRVLMARLQELAQALRGELDRDCDVICSAVQVGKLARPRELQGA